MTSALAWTVSGPVGLVALVWTAGSLAQTANELVVYDTVVRREITTTDDGVRAAGPVATFDTRAFRGDLSERGPAVDPSAEQVSGRPVVLPREYIEWKSGLRAAGPVILNDYYFDSAIDQGASYGYQTSGYTYDATCRTVTMVPASEANEANEVRAGRSALMQTRTGFSGTINAANLSCLVDISCNASATSGEAGSSAKQAGEDEDESAPTCLLDGAAMTLFESILECDDDGLCYQIEEILP